MTDMQPDEVTNLDGYGNEVLGWSRARDAMVKELPHPDVPVFLGTTDPDGRPHSTGIGIVWHDGDLYFSTGASTRKARNLRASPAATMSMRLTGIDLVLDGETTVVRDATTLEAVATLYRDGGWPAEVEGDALTAPFSAPSAGPPPWLLYRFRFHTAVGLALTEPYGATRWRFRRAVS
jgi:hypothetical protein